MQLMIKGFFFGSKIPYIAGSVTPKIPEIKFGIAISFSFLSFVLKNIASTTADVAKVQAKNGIITLSYPNVCTLLI